MLNITTELLFSKLNEEKGRGELISLPKDFYSIAEAFIKNLDPQNAQDTHQRQVENTQKILAGLREKRRQKLLVYLAYNKSLPQPIPEEEEDLYNEIRKVLDKNGERTKISRIKITTDVPEILTTEGRKIGPYRQGEIVEITNNKDTEFIMKNKIGEPID